MQNAIHNTKTCAVIGSGIAGLASAIRLAANGYQVDVFEANSCAGGKIRQSFEKGYRFDMGPSVITLPELIDELFELHGKNPRDYFTYTRLDHLFRYFFPDGTVINSYADVEKFGDEIEQKTTDSKATLFRYLDSARRKYEITRPVFIEQSIHRLKDFYSRNVLEGVRRFAEIDAFSSMDAVNRSYFSDSHLVELMNYYATYVGSNPFVAPGTLNVIQHLEINLGLCMPDKGIYSIVEALVKLAEEVGVRFHYNSRVEEIVVENKHAKGIKVAQEFLAFDGVMSNMDVYFTYNRLLPTQKQSKLILKQEKSSSVIGFFWGINNTYPEMQLHNMFFSENQKEEYDTVFNKKTVYHDPTMYICITSKHVKTDAPEGKENWFVLLNVPHNQGQDWEALVEQSRKNALRKINSMLKTQLEDYMETETVLSPPEIEARYSSAFGALYGNSSNGRFATFLRHANFSRRIKNLYFAGGSVHPGAGVPMCINSAKIAVNMLLED